MKKEIRHLATVDDYNRLFGVETLHPLVSVVDWSKCGPVPRGLSTYGFYAVFLKDIHCGDMLYGRQHYDYQEGTVVCVAPGQVVGTRDDGTLVQPHGHALVFHPDLIRGTQLARAMKDFTFFAYESNEALHLSERERAVFTDCLEKIRLETEHPIDRHSRRLITVQIETLLDYCLRFYERQFITRTNVNHDVLTRFEQLLAAYFDEGAAARQGLPTVKWCAAQLCLSPNYFGDLVKKETGKTAQEHIQLRLVETAKELLLTPRTSVSEVAYRLGFQYPQHFTRLFKKVTGQTPVEYRTALA